MDRRGVSAGGGQSSLGFLIGSGETASNSPDPKNQRQIIDNVPSQKPTDASRSIDKEIQAGTHGNLTDNYFQADGQSCVNFITDRPSTRVHAAPGGGLLH